MKLKYYLRTLGIAIFVTTLMLMISSGFHKMTDEQVIQRAKELGMVENKNQVLSDLREEQNNNSTTQSEDRNSTSESMENSGSKNEPDDLEQNENDNQSNPLEESNSVQEPEETGSSVETQPESIENPNDNETSDPEPENTTSNTEETNENPEMIEIVIVRGDSSVSVSRKLYDAGLVSSAAGYDRYLCNNKYDYSISVGTYQIPMGSSEEQIAKIITRK